MKKQIILLMMALLILPMASAAISELGTFRQYDCVNLIQTCADCTFINISSVLTPDSIQAIGQTAMTKTGTLFSYSFCNTSMIGKYTVNGFGDLGGTNSIWTYTFDINSLGNQDANSTTILIILFGLSFIILAIGISTKNIPMSILGGFAVAFIGLYTLNNGFAGYRTLATQWISILTMIFGGFWAVMASTEYLEV